jgi:hypothetical protein
VLQEKETGFIGESASRVAVVRDAHHREINLFLSHPHNYFMHLIRAVHTDQRILS